MNARRLFLSYSHLDSRWFQDDYAFALIPWLENALRTDGVTLWYDRSGELGLRPGDEFRREIEEAIDSCPLALILVSEAFFASDFIRTVELPRLLARAERGEMVLIPVLLEPCEWKRHEWLAARQMMPGEPTPLIDYTESERRWAHARAQILAGIRGRLTTSPRPQTTPVPAPSPDATAAGRLEAGPGGPPAPRVGVRVPAIAVAAVLGLAFVGFLVLRPPGAPPDTGPVSTTPAKAAASPSAVRTPTLVPTGQATRAVPSTPTAGPLLVPSPTVKSAGTPPPTGPALIEATTTLRYGNRLLAVALSPNGQTVAAVSQDTSVQTWDLPSTAEKYNFNPDRTGTRSLGFSPDGTVLATAGYGVRLWDAASGKELSTITKDAAWPAVFSPDGTLLAFTFSAQSGISGARDGIRLWDMRSASTAVELKGHTSSVDALAFAADGKTLVSASADGTVRVWDLATGRTTRTLRGHTTWVYSVALSPDGKMVASGTVSGEIRLWDIASGRDVFTLKEHSNAVNGLVFTADGKSLVSAGWDGKLRLWDVANGQRLWLGDGHTKPVTGITLANDGRTLATASEDGTVKLWTMKR